MTKTLETAENILLNNRGLELNDVQNTLDHLMLPSIDQADLYFQSAHSESWVLEDGIVREGSHNIDQGVGVRAISGEKTGFAYSDEIILPALTQAAKAASSIASHGDNGQLQVWKKTTSPILYNDIDPLHSITTEEKVNLLKQLDQAARQKDPRVKQVMVGLTGSQSTVLVANNEGQLSADVRPLVRLNVNVIVEEDGKIEKGGSGGGGRFGYEYFLNDGMAMSYVEEAVEQALINLKSDAAPAGTMS
ncbi:MAG: PmbA/TldA family metallopeptidase, partial [Gammaproteobacteria bacterium]